MLLTLLLSILAVAVVVYISLWYVFGFLYLKRIDSVDSAWGLGFVYLALISLFITENYSTIPLLSAALVCVWGLRLTYHITKRNLKKPEDERYAIYRKKFAENLNVKIYFNIFLVQGALMLIISSASIGAIVANEYIESLAYIGLFIWAFGIVFEALADYQLKQFLRQKTGKIMDKGLWHYSRHPNYFGEITSWVGASIVACSGGNYFGVLGAITIAFLIIKVSGIPPLEKKYKNSPEYQKYAKKTSVLIPLPPKN
jgi:steroid 5-alpha reductase family enzyme